MATWRKLIAEEMATYGEEWKDVESVAGADSFDVEFDEGWGMAAGQPFTVWTVRRVYFPAKYDGSEWCASVSRIPDNEVTYHIGGQ